jgi:hypothetical protein
MMSHPKETTRQGLRLLSTKLAQMVARQEMPEEWPVPQLILPETSAAEVMARQEQWSRRATEKLRQAQENTTAQETSTVLETQEATRRHS